MRQVGGFTVKPQTINLLMFLAIILANSAWLLNPHACCPIEPVTNQSQPCSQRSELHCPTEILSIACPALDNNTSAAQAPSKVNAAQAKDSLIGGSDSVPGLSSSSSDFQIQIPFYIAVLDSGTDPSSVTSIPLKRPPRIV